MGSNATNGASPSLALQQEENRDTSRRRFAARSFPCEGLARGATAP
jgi:hypothetical protein